MSVRKRKWTTGQWVEKEAWVVDYVDQHGKRRLRTFEKKKEAEAFETTMRGEVVAGTHVADSATVTVKEAGEDWLETCKAEGLERSTIEAYRQHLELHIVPLIGRLRLSALNVPAVRSLQDRLRAEGRSPTMVRRVTTSLGSLLAEAHERGLAAHNAVRDMSKRRPRGKDGKRHKAKLEVGVHIPSPVEVRAILEAAKGRWRPLLVTAIFSGMRASELRGLRWSDVDLSSGRLHVRQRADAYHVIGMPKSTAGQRSIPIPPIVVNTLREWKLKCPAGDLDLVFPTGAGNVESHANIVKRGFGRLR